MLPEPFQSFQKRICNLKNELLKEIEEIKQENLAGILSGENGKAADQKRLLYNYTYALLGQGTLLLRFGASFLICYYIDKAGILKEEGQQDEEFLKPPLNLAIVNNLKDSLPVDGTWKKLWEEFSTNLADQIVIPFKSLLDNELSVEKDQNILDRFVTIRNRVVHEHPDLNKPIWVAKALTDLATFASRVSLLEGLKLSEKDEYLYVRHGNINFSLRPLVKSGVKHSTERKIEVPLLFQGIYASEEKDKRLKFLHTLNGAIDKTSEVKVLEDFQSIGKDALNITGNDFKFNDMIAQYHECFVGRDQEVKDIIDFCKHGNQDNLLKIHAQAGFGKSALMAELSLKLKGDQLLHFCGTGERNNPLSIIASLLKKLGSVRYEKELKKKDKVAESIQKPPGSWQDLVAGLQQALENYNNILEERAKDNKMLTVIIDGVDEAAVAYRDLPIRDLMIMKRKDEEGNEKIESWTIPENIRFILGYRSGKDPVSDRGEKYELKALNRESVRQVFAGKVDISPEVEQAILEKGTAVTFKVKTFEFYENEEEKKDEPEEKELIDPSYLRFVYDEIISEKISAENAASIPNGLSGLYEKAIKQEGSYDKIERLLEILLLFSIAKEPVSESLAAAILKVNRQKMNSDIKQEYLLAEIKRVVNNHSKWFDRDQSSRLSLYHDRLRLYVLQRNAENELRSMNKSFVEYLKDKWELYDYKTIGSNEQREAIEYSLRQLVKHTRNLVDYNEFGTHSAVRQLVENEKFREKQVEMTGAYNLTQADLHIALKEQVRVVIDLEKERAADLQKQQSG